jgi:hypothetical protein
MVNNIRSINSKRKKRVKKTRLIHKKRNHFIDDEAQLEDDRHAVNDSKEDYLNEQGENQYDLNDPFIAPEDEHVGGRHENPYFLADEPEDRLRQLVNRLRQDYKNNYAPAVVDEFREQSAPLEAIVLKKIKTIPEIKKDQKKRLKDFIQKALRAPLAGYDEKYPDEKYGIGSDEILHNALRYVDNPKNSLKSLIANGKELGKEDMRSTGLKVLEDGIRYGKHIEVSQHPLPTRIYEKGVGRGKRFTKLGISERTTCVRETKLLNRFLKEGLIKEETDANGQRWAVSPGFSAPIQLTQSGKGGDPNRQYPIVSFPIVKTENLYSHVVPFLSKGGSMKARLVSICANCYYQKSTIVNRNIHLQEDRVSIEKTQKRKEWYEFEQVAMHFHPNQNKSLTTHRL